jgi:hypothetical protein
VGRQEAGPLTGQHPRRRGRADLNIDLHIDLHRFFILICTDSSYFRLMLCVYSRAVVQGGQGYNHGVFALSSVLLALRNLAISDAQKRTALGTCFFGILCLVNVWCYGVNSLLSSVSLLTTCTACFFRILYLGLYTAHCCLVLLCDLSSPLSSLPKHVLRLYISYILQGIHPLPSCSCASSTKVLTQSKICSALS